MKPNHKRGRKVACTKTVPYATPEIADAARAKRARYLRYDAAAFAQSRPAVPTKANGEECAPYAANFTKGLAHDADGLVAVADDYAAFVKAINAESPDHFSTVPTADSHKVGFACTVSNGKSGKKKPTWRGWESARAGHVYDLEGPDAGAVGMAPAPSVGSSELAAELAEVYGLAILRDVPFTEITEGGDTRIDGQPAEMSCHDVVGALNGMDFYRGKSRESDPFARRRREARTGKLSTPLTCANVFRGSAPGVMDGPYISQFMLVGNTGRDGRPDPRSSGHPGLASAFGIEQGTIVYGAQAIDQRIMVHKVGLDYMTDWYAWLDVQNGADLTKGLDRFEPRRRFITTPRDLATYVHFDALYQAYLNACLILLSYGADTDRGLPEPGAKGRRTAFATFGGPHILSLGTEVATRCLKAVRRQKFNYHRRARPEALAGRLTLVKGGRGDRLGAAREAFEATLDAIPDVLKSAINEHNRKQNRLPRSVHCPGGHPWPTFEDDNLLLPMAFPEGSPMHPSYGAGHATVAGGCITMLKAFFEMYDHHGILKPLTFPGADETAYFVPDAKGECLVPVAGGKGHRPLTIQGELNKLAANIAIGRDMAGVHYYSDYYDSLRMGERVAVGILLEQALTYGEDMEMTFDSFDGDHIVIAAKDGVSVLRVSMPNGTPLDPDTWWLRHVTSEPVPAPAMV